MTATNTAATVQVATRPRSTCARGLSTFIHSALLGSAWKVAEPVSLSPPRCSLSHLGVTITATYLIINLLLSFYSQPFLSTCIHPWTVCPSILHTRKLNFALSEGRSWAFPLPPAFNLGAAYNLIKKEGGCCVKHFAAWTKTLRAHGESLGFGQVRHKPDCLHVVWHWNCSGCWLSWFEGISLYKIWKADNASWPQLLDFILTCFKLDLLLSSFRLLRTSPLS